MYAAVWLCMLHFWPLYVIPEKTDLKDHTFNFGPCFWSPCLYNPDSGFGPMMAEVSMFKLWNKGLFASWWPETYRKRKDQGTNISFNAMTLVTRVPPSRPCPMAPWARDQAFHRSAFGDYSRSDLQHTGVIEKTSICDNYQHNQYDLKLPDSVENIFYINLHMCVNLYIHTYVWTCENMLIWNPILKNQFSRYNFHLLVRN